MCSFALRPSRGRVESWYFSHVALCFPLHLAPCCFLIVPKRPVTCLMASAVQNGTASASSISALPRARATRNGPRAPMASTTRQEAQKRRRSIQDAINEMAAEWMQYTLACAQKMADKFGKPASYYLNLLFSHSASHFDQRDINPWNAFLSLKSERVNDGTLLTESMTRFSLTLMPQVLAARKDCWIFKTLIAPSTSNLPRKKRTRLSSSTERRRHSISRTFVGMRGQLRRPDRTQNVLS